MTDIDVSKSVSTKLEVSEAQLRTFIDLSPFAIAMFDTNMIYLAASKRWIDDLVHGDPNIVGRSHYEVFPEIPERWKAIHKKCLAGAIEKSDEDSFPRADGSMDYLRWEIRPWRDHEGKIGGIIMFTEDISERKRAELALKESEARFRTLVENAPEAIVLLDLERQVFVEFNGNAEKLFGLSRAELLKKGPAEMSPPKQPDGRLSSELAEEKIREAAAGGTPVFEWTHRNGKGEDFPTEVRLVRMMSGGRVLIRGSITDITERKRSERLLRESMDSLAQSNAALAQFAYVASHDLRAPLRSIINWTQMLDILVPKPRSQELDQAIGFIQNSGSRAIALINEIMEMARLNVSSTPLVRVNLNETVRVVLENFASEINKIHASVSCGELPSLVGIPTHFESLFTNLIQNALTYREQTRGLEIQIGCVECADRYELSVRDNGIGVEPQYQEKIFEMFTRLHSEQEYPSGTGIGLAFCKKVVELGGGRIWVRSALGQGCTVYFSFPKQGGAKL